VALVWLAACDNNPLSFDVKEGTEIFVNPSEMVVPAGRTGKLESRTVNPANQSTFQEIAWAIDPTCGSGAITVTDDPDEAELIEAGIKPPGAFAVTGGSTLGQSCVVLTSGSLTTQVDVTVVGEAIVIISAPDTLRAGETGTVVAGLVDAAGGSVGPYDPADAGWTSEASDVADFTDDVGNFATSASGTAVLRVTWVGTESNGTNVDGVVLEDDHVLTVVANVPVGLDPDNSLDNGDDFGVIAVDQVATAEILVVDAFGNQNTNETEILGCSATSSNAAIAAADCAIELASAHAIVSVTGVAVGSGVTISGDVTTTEGTYTWGPAPVSVLNPVIESVTPSQGPDGTAVTVVGAGFTFAGFDTQLAYRANTATGQPQIWDDLFIDALTETQADLVIPPGFPIGEYEIILTIGVTDDDGVVQGVSDLVLFNQNGADLTEPANDDPATAPTVGLPADIVGVLGLGADVDDFFLFTLTATTTFVVDLDWDDDEVDLDILVVDQAFTAFVCPFDGATGAKPEQVTCTLDAGTYALWLNNFSGADHPTKYRATITP
jgi:hypothetical protein